MRLESRALEVRAKAYAALGDPRRLAIVDLLVDGDRSVAELSKAVGMPGNLVAHHLDVLEAAGLIRRRPSDGDHRLRYVTLQWDSLPSEPHRGRERPKLVAFVCTHNSARSQFAAALWSAATGGMSASAGTHPAEHVHPSAVQVAPEFGIDLSTARPAGYDSLPPDPDLVVSVCDRARESDLPDGREYIHWSVPDPVPDHSLQSFRSAFSEIAQRVEQLARETQTNQPEESMCP
jgi:protein-tyrosine-phosphatase